jgi:hypothetical protein
VTDIIEPRRGPWRMLTLGSTVWAPLAPLRAVYPPLKHRWPTKPTTPAPKEH